MKISKWKAALAMAALSSAATAATAKQPNVIFILADDLGWADTTLYGHTSLYQTPNIERLARRGMTFTRAYANSPLCSPTRASLLTGQTPARHGSTRPEHHLSKVVMKPAVMKSAPAGNKALSVQTVTRLDNKLPTLGKLLKEGGYSTGHFGKWHLGPEPYSPLQHGFDIDIPHWHGPGPAGGFVAPWKYKQLKPNKPDEHIEDRMAEEAVKWLRSVEGTQPFFMNYWQFSVHAPFDAKKELIEHYRTKLEKLDNKDGQQSPTYAAMVHSLDDAVGTLLDAIDKAGLADETVIVFFSDNGGNMYAKVDDTYPTSNRPLRGGKATIFEGGIRGPCIIAWPGVTEPGSRCDEPIQASDFYPTFQKQLGLPVKESHIVDGIDIMPALRGEKLNREAIFTYFPFAPARVPDWTPDSVAVHAGDWKLIRFFCQGENGNHDYQLYNLADDIGEKNDLAKVSPSKVSELDKLIEGYLNRSNAVVPVPNPAFDPSQYKPELIGVPAGRNSMQKPTKQSSKRKKKANTK